jgi:hypothetical protein
LKASVDSKSRRERLSKSPLGTALKRVIFHSEADAEMVAAAEFYESKSTQRRSFSDRYVMTWEDVVRACAI